MEFSGNFVQPLGKLCALCTACVKQSICSQAYVVDKNCWFEQCGTTGCC